MNNAYLYEHKDYRELKTEANNEQIEKLQFKIDDLKKKKAKIPNYASFAESKKHRYNVLINLYTREIEHLTHSNQTVNTKTKEEVFYDGYKLSNLDLKIRNKFYEDREEKITELESNLAAQRDRISRMSDGKVKTKAELKAAQLEWDINRLKSKNIKSEKKQVAILMRKEKLNNFITRKKVNNLKTRREVNKMLAKRDTYINEKNDARSAQRLAGISPAQKTAYAAIVVNRIHKIQKLNKKLDKIRQSRVVAQGGNPVVIPARQRATQGRTR